MPTFTAGMHVCAHFATESWMLLLLTCRLASSACEGVVVSRDCASYNTHLFVLVLVGCVWCFGHVRCVPKTTHLLLVDVDTNHLVDEAPIVLI